MQLRRSKPGLIKAPNVVSMKAGWTPSAPQHTPEAYRMKKRIRAAPLSDEAGLDLPPISRHLVPQCVQTQMASKTGSYQGAYIYVLLAYLMLCARRSGLSPSSDKGAANGGNWGWAAVGGTVLFSRSCLQLRSAAHPRKAAHAFLLMLLGCECSQAQPHHTTFTLTG
jgi:hypothetical protein